MATDAINVYEVPEPSDRWSEDWNAWADAVVAEIIRFTDDYYEGDNGEAMVAVAELMKRTDQDVYDVWVDRI